MVAAGVLQSAGIAAVGALGHTLLSKVLEARTWTLLNEDTREAIKGQFASDAPTFDYGANWAEIRSMGRAHPLLQFLQGQSDRFDVNSMFFRRDISDDNVKDRLEKILNFSRFDQRLGRPPICRFAIGNGEIVNMEVVLYKVGSIQYGIPDFLGAVRQVSFTMHFQRFTRFSLNDIPEADTRYHRTSEGQYYELIANAEYGDPMIGDFIRKQPEQVGKALLVPGDIVKLPAGEGVKDKIVKPTSTVFSSSFGRLDTPQKLRREERLVALSQPVELFSVDITRISAQIRAVASQSGGGLGAGGLGSMPLGSAG